MGKVTEIFYQSSWLEQQPGGLARKIPIRELRLTKDGDEVECQLTDSTGTKPALYVGRLPLDFLSTMDSAIPDEICSPSWGKEHLSRYVSADSKFVMRIIIAKTGQQTDAEPAILMWEFDKYLSKIPRCIPAMTMMVDGYMASIASLLRK
jgi:hypothetical protein